MSTSGVEHEVNSSSVTTGSRRLLDELPREKLAWMLQKMCETRYFEEAVGIALALQMRRSDKILL